MDITTFNNSIANLKEAIKNIKKENIDITKKADSEKSLYDFKEKKLGHIITSYKKAIEELISNSFGLNQLIKLNKNNELAVIEVHKVIKDIEKYHFENNLEGIDKNLDKIAYLLKKLNYPEQKPLEKPSFNLKNKKLPPEIKDEINADIKELEKCFISGCHRSAVMLCGRLLEIALHRKYYEFTGYDILEKSPGIGLGKIIAKLTEKEIKFDPGITQQIHLINQLRISSVHKQKDAFYPTKQQTHAIILYTLDVLEKLFR